jgi:hypothetical protein
VKRSVHKGCRECEKKTIYSSIPTHATTDLVNSLYYNKYIANTKHVTYSYTIYSTIYIISIYTISSITICKKSKTVTSSGNDYTPLNIYPNEKDNHHTYFRREESIK